MRIIEEIAPILQTALLTMGIEEIAPYFTNSTANNGDRRDCSLFYKQHC